AEHAAPQAIILLLRLALIFGTCLAVTLSLCWALLQRVRAIDARNGLEVSRLDSLSIKSVFSLTELQKSHATFVHVFEVEYELALLAFACTYLMKQTFAIPGSALLNVFAGAVLPLYLAFPLVAVLTACGASCCYLLSRFLASEAIVRGACD
ncbi:TPA: hypothetical protein N0F65_009343, partial [Lagenidium giganteum]